MHNFKKILPRVAVLLAFVFLLEAGIRFLYEPYTQYSIYAHREYQSMKEEVDTLFCGTSKTYSGYDPAVYDSSTGAVSFNLGTGSQPLVTTKIILVSPPLPEVLLSLAGDMNNMHATYQAIADSHGIPFYDMNFYTKKNTVFNRELFRDIVHLNRNGAEIYTGLIAEIHESGDAYPTYFTEEYMGEVAEPAA